MFSLQWMCPHCASEESFTLSGVLEYLAREPVPAGSTTEAMTRRVVVRQGHEIVRAYGTACCRKCNGPILIWFECVADALRRIRQSSGAPDWRYSGPGPKILGVHGFVFVRETEQRAGRILDAEGNAALDPGAQAVVMDGGDGGGTAREEDARFARKGFGFQPAGGTQACKHARSGFFSAAGFARCEGGALRGDVRGDAVAVFRRDAPRDGGE